MHDHDLKRDTPAGNSIGYRQTLEYLSSEWAYPNETTPTAATPTSQSDVRKHFLDYLFLYQARTRLQEFRCTVVVYCFCCCYYLDN